MSKRLIAVSDSHGDAESLRAALEQAARHGKMDAVVFLGDGSADFEEVKSWLNLIGCVWYEVKGNNDWHSSEPAEIVFTVNGVRIYACHGHTRNVKYGLERLWFAAREKQAAAALYGHTHRERIDIEYGIHLINPGAVCERSRQRSAYAEIIVEDSGFVCPGLVKWEK